MLNLSLLNVAQCRKSGECSEVFVRLDLWHYDPSNPRILASSNEWPLPLVFLVYFVYSSAAQPVQALLVQRKLHFDTVSTRFDTNDGNAKVRRLRSYNHVLCTFVLSPVNIKLNGWLKKVKTAWLFYQTVLRISFFEFLESQSQSMRTISYECSTQYTTKNQLILTLLFCVRTNKIYLYDNTSMSFAVIINFYLYWMLESFTGRT